MKTVNQSTAKTKQEERGFRVQKIQRSCVHDGPGIRTTVFFCGCALRCQWCQNPENLEFGAGEACGVQELAQAVMRDQRYYEATGGGVTLSGGEPLLQNRAALLEFAQLLHRRNIPLAIETALQAPWDAIEAMRPYTACFLVDIKLVGNPEQHKVLTGQDGRLIQENLARLCAEGAKLQIRMVVLPGINDGEEALQNLAARLKELGISSIELLQYFNLYEDKARRLGVEMPALGITAEQSLAALRRVLERLQALGLQVHSDAQEYPIIPAQFTKRVLAIQQAQRESGRAACFEVSRLKTEYYKKYKGFSKPTPIHRSERLHYVLQRKTVRVYPDELLVGNFTSKRVAGQIWEEQYGILDISYLYKASRQTPVAFQSTRKERLHFYGKIVPYWARHSIFTKAQDGVSGLLRNFARIAEMRTGFNNNLAAIAHFAVNFSRILELGTTGLSAEIRRTMRDNPNNNQDFYKGILTSLNALAAFADRYVQELNILAEKEENPERREQLEKMAQVCARVPKYPARSFHEALQSMVFLQIALCTEGYENAVSFGRVDQLLHPYYQRDLESGVIHYEQAKELLALFILKMDECILLNDGDSFLSVGKLFETLSTDQALTFGGVDGNGEDATNPITYMLIDICELQPLAVNMCARIHASSPQQYLDRLAEIYIRGCPMPELFSDDAYIEAILRRFDTTPEQARNYSIVGCVEPTASDDHFGNTDSANMNLTLPLLQALKGQEDDLWNYGLRQQMGKLGGKVAGQLFGSRYERLKQGGKLRAKASYYPPATMEELLARFSERLLTLARSILADQQKIEAVLRRDFTTPLASSLFRGCVARGKDAYEGGTDFRSAGIQAVGVTDVADSLCALETLVFQEKRYTIEEILAAMDADFSRTGDEAVLQALLAIPKFGDDTSERPVYWVNRVMEIYDDALRAIPYAVRDGIYVPGYYALNTNDRYGKNTQALPSGRKKGVPLANSVTPHYGMEQNDLLSALHAMEGVDFKEHAVNGTTATLTVDSALFPGEKGVHNLAQLIKTFLTGGGMQFQPNIISRELLLDAYQNPDQYPYLMVRVAGYCAYFRELSDELKLIIIHRSCYS